jgi:hypothetical protein
VTYDDGIGVDEVPWDEFDVLVHYLPRGLVHWGAALRIAAMPDSGERLPAGPLIELGAFLDLRYRMQSPWRMRFVVAASFQPPEETRPGGGQIDWSSPFAVRFRWLPLSLDLHQWVTLRAGGEIGLQLVPIYDDVARWDALPGLLTEIAVRALDGLLEIAFTLGCQGTGIGVADRSGDRTDLVAQAVVGGSVGYLFP